MILIDIMASLKIFAILVVVLSLKSTVFGQDTVRPVRVFSKQSRDTEACVGTNLLQCSKDCASLMACMGDGTSPKWVSKCQSSTPYCTVAGKSANCAPSVGTCTPPDPTTNGDCTGAGYYPDASDCTKSILCGGVGQYLSTFKCPNGYVYSSSDSLCKRGIACSNVVCPKDPVLAPYTPNAHFFYYCEANKKPIVFQCEGELERFSATGGCQFVCPGEDKYAKDDTSYYQCYREGNVLKYTIENCPTGYLYDKTTKICVKAPVVPPVDPPPG